METNSVRFCFVTLLFQMTILLGGCNNETAHGHDTYTCPMHPTVISDRPGICPICGMDLVKKARPGEEVEITGELTRLLKSPSEQVIASAKTIKGTYEKFPGELKAQGTVTYDTRNIFSIPSRVAGRLDKVYIKSVFQKIEKGQRIADVYSPELVAAQRELIFVRDNDPDNSELIGGATEKLRLLGMTERDIDQLITSKNPKMTFTIYSPYSGYVISTNVTANEKSVANAASATPSSTAMSSMKGSSSAPAVEPDTSSDTDASLTREGQYVSAGQVLFNVVSTRDLRVELKMPATQSVRNGDIVKLEFPNGQSLTSKIDFLQPFYNAGESFMTARVNVPSDNRIQIGQLAQATISLTSFEGLWIPSSAVLDLGLSKVVFVKEKNVFKSKKIFIGEKADGMVQVKSGLSSSDEIAERASYLVDSESFIKTVN